MAELRALMEAIGFSSVRTLLASGNVVFASSGGNPAKHARAIHTALSEESGLNVPVIVKSAAEFAAIVKEHPIRVPEENASKLLIAFVQKVHALLEEGAARPGAST